jgi:hypothetical protein
MLRFDSREKVKDFELEMNKKMITDQQKIKQKPQINRINTDKNIKTFE